MGLRVMSKAIKKTIKRNGTAQGIKKMRIPMAVAAPLPPWNLRKMGKIWPAMAAAPVRKSNGQIGAMSNNHRTKRIAPMPLPRSAKVTSTASIGPTS